MKLNSKTTLIAMTGAICITLVSAALGSIPHMENGAFLLLPGVLVSAVFFSTGIHSDYPMAFMIVAGLANIAIYACVIGLIYNFFGKNRA